MSEERVRALWKGNTATVARVVPYAATQFGAYEQYSKLVMSVLKIDKREHLPPLMRFACGSAAGISAVALTYPLDLVRARMAVNTTGSYQSMPHAFREIVRKEGWASLYNGGRPTFLGILPYAGSVWMMVETLKARVRVWVGVGVYASNALTRVLVCMRQRP